MLIFTGRIFREGDAFVSYCDQLDAATCGSTIDEVYRRTEELIEIHIEFAQEHGTLGDLLSRCSVPEDSGFDLASREPPSFLVNLNLLIAHQSKHAAGHC